MAKLSNKKPLPHIELAKKEEKKDPEYVKNTVSGDVGKVLGRVGSCWKVEFKIKGIYAVSISDTIIPIDEKEYTSTKDSSIVDIIINLYRKGLAVDDLFSKRRVLDDGSPVSGEASHILKDKVEKKMLDLGTDKASIRSLLNEKNIDQMKLLCKKMNIEIGKYSHLSGGLLKMSLVNVALGKVTTYLSNGTWDLNKMKEELK